MSEYFCDCGGKVQMFTSLGEHIHSFRKCIKCGIQEIVEYSQIEVISKVFKENNNANRNQA